MKKQKKLFDFIKQLALFSATIISIMYFIYIVLISTILYLYNRPIRTAVACMAFGVLLMAMDTIQDNNRRKQAQARANRNRQARADKRHIRAQQERTEEKRIKEVREMEENNNFISISQVIKELDGTYTDTEEETNNLYNSSFIFEY